MNQTELEFLGNIKNLIITVERNTKALTDIVEMMKTGRERITELEHDGRELKDDHKKLFDLGKRLSRRISTLEKNMVKLRGPTMP